MREMKHAVMRCAVAIGECVLGHSRKLFQSHLHHSSLWFISFDFELLLCYTISGSFLLSLEKPLEEYVRIAYTIKAKMTTPAAT